MKAVVFGSGGYIGTRLVKALRAQGHEVVAESSRKKGGAIDPCKGSLREGYTLPAETDVIFYLSQSPFYRDLPGHIEHVMAVNCFTPHSLATLAAEAGVGRFVYASTGSVYEPSFDPLKEDALLCSSNLYALSKIVAEQTLAKAGGALKICCARLFGVYGPHQPEKMVTNLCERLRQGQAIFLEHDPKSNEYAGIRLSMTYVTDAVSAMIALAGLETPPQVVNVAGSEALSIREIVTALSERLGVVPHFEKQDRPLQGYYIADTALFKKSIRFDETPFLKGLDNCVRPIALDS